MKTKTIHKPEIPAPQGKATKAHPTKNVRFKIALTNAKAVALVGAFTEWEARPIPLTESRPGRWEVEIELPSGRHEYLFLTDQGEWLRDPEAIESIPNPWGELNSMIHVGLPT